MEEKNIALLGFVSEATNFLKDKIDDSAKIKKLNEADLEKIRNDLSRKINFSFDNVDNKTDDLIDIGRKAFGDFISESSDNNMIEEFANIFNGDFKKENDEKDEKMRNHLLKILKEPKKNEESDEFEDIILRVSSNTDENKEKEKLYKDNFQDKEIDSIFNEIIAHETFEDLKEKEDIDNKDDVVLVEEDSHAFLANEQKEDNKLNTVEKEATDRLTSSEFRNILEDVLSDVLFKISEAKKENNEEVTNEEVIKVENKTSFEDILDNKVDNEEIDVQSDHEAVALIKDILSNLNDNIEKEKESNIDKEEEKKDILNEDNNKEASFEENTEEIEEKLSNEEDIAFEDTFIDIEDDETDDVTIDDVEEAGFEEDLNINNDDIIEENIVDEDINTNEENTLDDENVFVDKEYVEDYNNRSLDEIYIANPGLNALKNNDIYIEENNILEENKEDTDLKIDENLSDSALENENDYLSDLIDTLNKDDFAKKIEENKRKEEELKSRVYDSIREIYPYLSNGFIKGVYDLKEVFASEYKESEKLVILHRLVFEDVDGLRKFVEVMMSHNYLINVDEKKMIVDVFKEHINADGKILTDIFEVANQAKYLTGEYDGYRIIKEEEIA